MEEMLQEFTSKFDYERDKFRILLAKHEAKNKSLESIEVQYNNLVSFIESQSAFNIITRINEIEGFIKSTGIEISKSENFKMEEMKLNPALKPIQINAEKAVAAIAKF